LRLPFAGLLQKTVQRQCRRFQHLLFPRRNSWYVGRQQEVEAADLDTVTREEKRSLIARLDAVQEMLPLPQEILLLNIIAERAKRIADRMRVAGRLLQLFCGVRGFRIG
jgi:hypothetical protein